MNRLLCMALCLLTLSGCRPLREPTDSYVISALALDWQGGYRVAAEMGDPTAGEEGPVRPQVFAGAGETVSQGLYDLANRASREIFFGKTGLVLLGETMPGDRADQALRLMLEHRSDGDMLLACVRAAGPEAALSFGEEGQMCADLILGLIKDGARRCACPETRAKEAGKQALWALPEITVEDRGAALTGIVFYKDGAPAARLEGQQARMFCLLSGQKVLGACALYGPDWAVWLKKAKLKGDTLTLTAAFCEGTPEDAAQTAQTLAEQVLRVLGPLGWDLPERVKVRLVMP